MRYTKQLVEEAVKNLGHKWFENGDYNLNIVGIRNSGTGDAITNKFDDWITVSFKTGPQWHYYEFPATTDPGKHWAENLMNPNGVAILVPGQYRGSHAIGQHRGKYSALKQINNMKVYRDKDLDREYDMEPDSIREGTFGINIHRASEWGKSTQIDKWSAGCQVLADNYDFKRFMELADRSSGIWGNKFTYTLIESKDI
jgi:hypothetical protein